MTHPLSHTIRADRWDGTSGFGGVLHDPVRVWLARVPDDPEIVSARSVCLSVEERARAARFRHSGSRDEFVFGRIMLRELAGSILGVPSQRLRFSEGAFGKPYVLVPRDSELQFNISHAGGWVVVAVSRLNPVGVDIEPSAYELPIEFLTKQVCSVGEAALLAGLPVDRRNAEFLRIWTVKEAFFKATGEGLTERMASVDACALPLPWNCAGLELPEGIIGAVVWQGDLPTGSIGA